MTTPGDVEDLESSPRLKQAILAESRGDLADAIDIYESLASLGSRLALVNVAMIYEWGRPGVPIDFEAARRWYEKGWSEYRLVECGLALGNFYYHGLGVPIDFKKAFSYYFLLDGTNHPVALLRLGVMYELGQGIDKDLQRARECYRRSAKEGNIFARSNWGSWEMRYGNILLGAILRLSAILERTLLAAISRRSRRLRVR